MIFSMGLTNLGSEASIYVIRSFNNNDNLYSWFLVEHEIVYEIIIIVGKT